jgi:pimeloyl-ACP methyl ester carboxylesterase
LPSQALAQPERYELGRRLGAFELAWDKNNDAAARKRAAAIVWNVPLQTLMTQIPEAGRSFDEARHALDATQPVPPETLWAESLFVAPSTRLIDASQSELPFSVRQFYPARAAAPREPRVGLALFAGGTFQVPIARLPMEGKWPLQGGRTGDQLVHMTIRSGDKVVAQSMFKVSIVKDLMPRLQKLKRAIDGFGPRSGGTDHETVREIHGLLTALASGETRETDYPAARLLAEAEAAVAAIQAGQRYFGGDKTGQFWLRLPGGSAGSLPVRLLAPDAVKDQKPLPLVIAMHGLGGSENMFFEAYGSGLAAKMCQERGWLLVSPRSFLGAGHSIAALADEVGKLYPVDRSRVFVVGHSIGALQALVAAQDNPGRFAAIAMLGTGGSVKARADLKRVPFFVGVGTTDIAHKSARSLADKLTRAGAGPVEFKEYPDLEHYTVVRAALPDVFGFFDRSARASTE